MSRLAVIVPTVGRPTLRDLLFSLAPQLEEGDRVMVVVDDMLHYDFCLHAIADARDAGDPAVYWRCYPMAERGGCYGHPARNLALDLLADLDGDAPEWTWSLDDDDVACPGAVEAIRAQLLSGDAPWYIFQMRGGAGSHYPGLVVPALGPSFAFGNVGTPMIVAPVSAARWGTGVPGVAGALDEGYCGDWDYAQALLGELGEPKWVGATVAEVRPVTEG